jgi:hypothetical protein
MQAVETEGALQEVIGALGGAANTGNLDYFFRQEAELENRGLYLVGDHIMAAAWAKRRRSAFVIFGA